MHLHANAKLGLAGRLALVRAIEDGRSSRPRHSPRQLAPELEEAICRCRRQTGWGPRLIAGTTGWLLRRCRGEGGLRDPIEA